MAALTKSRLELAAFGIGASFHTIWPPERFDTSLASLATDGAHNAVMSAVIVGRTANIQTQSAGENRRRLSPQKSAECA
jgi:hypothetical protein